MLLIPLGAVPSQTLAVTLAGQSVQMALRTIGGSLYTTIDSNGGTIVTNRICRNRQRLLLDATYHGFLGNFAFIDMRGDTDPIYTGLGTRYALVYFNDGE